jgi:hypothetical protein
MKGEEEWPVMAKQKVPKKSMATLVTSGKKRSIVNSVAEISFEFGDKTPSKIESDNYGTGFRIIFPKKL